MRSIPALRSAHPLAALLAWLPLALLPAPAPADNDISKVNGSIRVAAGEHVGDVDTVNGTIDIEAGAAVQDISTVNGSIRVGERVTAQKIETVNGAIKLGAGAQAKSLETVNGAMRLEETARVTANVSAVNGRIQLARDSEVGGNLSTVNGRIELSAAHVAGGIKTVGGSIELDAGSRVDGGILVEKPTLSFLNIGKRTPTIVIGPNATVGGALKFERKVELYVSDSAKIGAVEGATPIKFSGERPGLFDGASRGSSDGKVEK